MNAQEIKADQGDDGPNWVCSNCGDVELLTWPEPYKYPPPDCLTCGKPMALAKEQP